MKIHTVMTVMMLVAAALPLRGSAAQSLSDADNRQAPASKSTAKLIQVKVQIQASSALFEPWPHGGQTWHHGKGFMEPIGLVEYWCGRGFDEQKQAPQPEFLRSLDKAFVGSSVGGNGEMLFCIYRLKGGDLYVYDSPVGILHEYQDDHNPRVEEALNFVVGGTNAYRGATGIWMGDLEGRGKSVFPSGTGAQIPEVLMKLMEGYIKLP